MRPYSSGTGWCEFYVAKKFQDVPVVDYHNRPSSRTERRAYWSESDSINVYDPAWGHQLTLERRQFFSKSQADQCCKYGTGGHNWYMTTRFDVWFTNPFDGWMWWGNLITGGINFTFKVRRTKESPLFLGLKDEAHKRCRRFDGRITQDNSGLFRVYRGDEFLWCARYAYGHFIYSRQVGGLPAQRNLASAARLLREPFVSPKAKELLAA